MTRSPMTSALALAVAAVAVLGSSPQATAASAADPAAPTVAATPSETAPSDAEGATTSSVDPDVHHYIVGGSPASEGEYPWAARLSIRTSQGTFSCGGTLISRDIVLSAQHCFDGSVTGFTASIGRVDHTQGTQRTGTQFRVGGGPQRGDWAVLKLTEPLPLDSYVRFPADTSYDTTPEFTAIGWGATSEGGSSSRYLMEVDLPLVPDSSTACDDAPSVEICAGDLQDGGIDTCQGDSGGPLMARAGQEWVQTGITSWGIGCARPGQPGHYAQVSAFLPQIASAITQLGGQQYTTVDGGGPDTDVLENGAAVTISGAAGSEARYTFTVPATGTDATVSISGGTGDGDLYVKKDSAPTTSVYDCRPYRSGNNESCPLGGPGTYHVMVRGYSSFSGVALLGAYTDDDGGGSGPQTYTSTTDVAIRDRSTAESPIAISGRTGSGSATATVAVDIVHTWIGDLKVELVAPDGSAFTLHNRTGSSTDDIRRDYTVNLSGESLAGTWKLRVNDAYSGDTGYINGWSLST